MKTGELLWLRPESGLYQSRLGLVLWSVLDLGWAGALDPLEQRGRIDMQHLEVKEGASLYVQPWLWHLDHQGWLEKTLDQAIPQYLAYRINCGSGATRALVSIDGIKMELTVGPGLARSGPTVRRVHSGR